MSEMSHRRGYGNGIIRPRPLNTNYRKTDKEFSIPMSPKKGLFVLVITFGVVFIFMATSALFKPAGDPVGGPALNAISGSSGGKHIRSGVQETNDYGDDEPGANGLASDDAEEDEEEEEEDSSAAEDNGSEEDNTDDAEEDTLAETSERGMAADSTPVRTSPNRASSQQSKGENKLKLNLQRYFTNAGKKHVTMESSGSFKYIMAQITDSEGTSALVIQGCPSSLGKKCKHFEAAEHLKSSLRPYEIKMKVVGGGRITWHGLRKSKRKLGVISIFGYSKTYGVCEECNKKACDIVYKQYPDYVVKYSNQGYTEKDEYKIRDFVKCSD